MNDFIDGGAAVAGCGEDRARSWRPGKTQSGNSAGFPRRRLCRCRFQHLLHRRAVYRLQIRHPRPENRQLLQSLHVSSFTFSHSNLVHHSSKVNRTVSIKSFISLRRYENEPIDFNHESTPACELQRFLHRSYQSVITTGMLIFLK